MANFNGNELITTPYDKYKYLLECKERVEKFGFLIRVLETDEDKLAQKLSEFKVFPSVVKTLEGVGIITVRDLARYIMSNHPKSLDDVWTIILKIPGIGPEGARSAFLRVFA